MFKTSRLEIRNLSLALKAKFPLNFPKFIFEDRLKKMKNENYYFCPRMRGFHPTRLLYKR